MWQLFVVNAVIALTTYSVEEKNKKSIDLYVTKTSDDIQTSL